jgi:C4-dicarboxylate-binding protein DctP
MHRVINAVLIGAVFLSPAAASAADTVIKFSHVVAEDTPKGKAALRFKELAEQRSAGKVKVEVYPNAKLMDDESVVGGLLAGSVQMAAPSLSLLEPYTKAYQVFDLPFLLKDRQAVERFQNSPAQGQLLDAMRDKGIEGLCFMHNGMKQLSANTALRLPEDAKGKRFRIQPSSVLVAQFEALGAVPVKAPFTKVFHMLQAGAVDGQENTWSNMYSQRFYEVQPYITEANIGSLEYMFIVADDFWSALPGDVRSSLTEAAKEACAYGNSIAAELNATAKQKIIASGYSQIIELSPEQRARWVEAVKPVWTLFENDIGREIMDAAKAANGAS